MEYKPITRQEILNTLVIKFGAVEVVRYYLNDAISDLQTIRIGAADNNPLQTASAIESLTENLNTIKAMIDKKENKPPLEKEIKNTLAE